MIENRIETSGVYLWVKTNPMINLENMISSSDFLVNEENLPEVLRILEDATDSVVSFGVRDFEKLADRINKVSEKFKIIKHAVIHNSPKNTAFTLYFKNNYVNNRYKLEVFSTFEAASNWLGIIHKN